VAAAAVVVVMVVTLLSLDLYSSLSFWVLANQFGLVDCKKFCELLLT